MRDDERTDEGMQEETGEEPAAPEGEAADTSNEDSASADSAAEEPEMEHPDFGAEEPAPDTDVFDMLRAAIGLFTQEAWIALGLQPRYGSGDTVMDLRCAKVAIDTTQMLVERLGDEADAEEKREFERILTDLRVNFMRRRKAADEEA